MCSEIPVTAAPESAEARLCLARSDLLNDYRICRSATYYLSTQAGEPLREGKIKFLILYPDLSLFEIEVK